MTDTPDNHPSRTLADFAAALEYADIPDAVLRRCEDLFLDWAGSALAGTTGTEFQTMYTTLLNWATGFLGKSIAIAAFILGAGIGIARSSPIPALAGVVFALFMVYVPTIIDSIMTAVI